MTYRTPRALSIPVRHTERIAKLTIIDELEATMPTPEQKVVQQIKDFIGQQQREDTFVFKSVDVPEGYPDLQGSWFGKPFSIEVKQPGKEPRMSQLAWQDRLRKSGYVSGTVASVDEFLALMEEPHPLDFLRRGKEPRVKGWPTK